MYAHTDKMSGRSVVEAPFMAYEVPSYAEQWHALDRALLPSIHDLAQPQQIRFDVGAHECERRLGGLS